MAYAVGRGWLPMAAYTRFVGPIELAIGRREDRGGPLRRAYWKYVSECYGTGIEHSWAAAPD